jgi:hypothetical protein
VGHRDEPTGAHEILLCNPTATSLCNPAQADPAKFVMAPTHKWALPLPPRPKPASSSACHGTDCIAVFASQNTEVSPRRLQSKNEDGVASVVALAMSVSTHVHAFRIPSQVPKAKFGSPSASPHPNDSPLLRCASSSCPSLLVGGYRGPDWHPYWT